MTALTQDILTGGIVSVGVGPQDIPFDVHVELLCAHSPYFDEALEHRFDENGTDAMYLTLPDDDPELFTRVISWMYSRRLGVTILDESTTWKLVCDLWLLADKYQIFELQNHVIDILKQKYSVLGRCNFAPSFMSNIYEKTLPSSHLRRAVSCMAVWAMDVDYFKKHCTAFPTEFRKQYVLHQPRKASGKLGNKMPLTWETHTFYVEAPDYEPLPSTPTAGPTKTPTASPAQDPPTKETFATLQERVAALEQELAHKDQYLHLIATAAWRSRDIKPLKARSASGSGRGVSITSASPVRATPSTTPPSTPRSTVDDLADLLEAL